MFLGRRNSVVHKEWFMAKKIRTRELTKAKMDK